MAKAKRIELSEPERQVLAHLIATGEPMELGELAERWWGSDVDLAAEALEELVERGLLKSEHLYPGQLLFQRIDPKSVEGRARGARSLYRVTRQGKAAVR